MWRLARWWSVSTMNTVQSMHISWIRGSEHCRWLCNLESSFSLDFALADMSWASWDDGNSPTIVVGRTRNLYGHNKGIFAAVVQKRGRGRGKMEKIKPTRWSHVSLNVWNRHRSVTTDWRITPPLQLLYQHKEDKMQPWHPCSVQNGSLIAKAVKKIESSGSGAMKMKTSFHHQVALSHQRCFDAETSK